ncbi:LPS export ABC transporter periplasmic protein LptC [Alteromonadaceae bacterium BrNp21-10]|nr:LPS export ABC transporter periplasmic protein LptC [Alteromonadaceae bacterium BrNp21-10]
MNRISLSIIVLFVIVIALNFNSWFADEKPLSTKQTEEVWRPNYQAKAMRSTLYNENGDINHQVFAEQMEHYQLLGFTLFQQPQYTIFSGEEKSPWKISASEGTLYDDNRLHLEKNVVIMSMDKNGFIQTINTEFVEIDLTAKTLASDQIVTIKGSEFAIQGNGFTANLDKRTFELLNHVKSTFSSSIVN